jgi:hypothetical protein
MINVGCQLISATLGIFNPLHLLQQKTTNEAQTIEKKAKQLSLSQP